LAVHVNRPRKSSPAQRDAFQQRRLAATRGTQHGRALASMRLACHACKDRVLLASHSQEAQQSAAATGRGRAEVDVPRQSLQVGGGSGGDAGRSSFDALLLVAAAAICVVGAVLGGLLHASAIKSDGFGCCFLCGRGLVRRRGKGVSERSCSGVYFFLLYWLLSFLLIT
jgi:hypothetical protein